MASILLLIWVLVTLFAASVGGGLAAVSSAFTYSPKPPRWGSSNVGYYETRTRSSSESSESTPAFVGLLWRPSSSSYSLSSSSSFSSSSRSRSSKLYLFDKVFEEEGLLGKGVTVGKIQVALNCIDRSPTNSIFGLLEENAKLGGDSQYELAQMAHEMCLTLLRKKNDWTAACSESKWFSTKDSGKAESQYNEWANREAVKFEKEYIPGDDTDEKGGGPTLAVVSLIIEIEGDQTDFKGAGYSISGTNDVLSSIAGNVMVNNGECVNAVEIFWTPGDGEEVLTNRDIIVDFPELIDL